MLQRLARIWHKFLWTALYVTPVLLASYYFGGNIVRGLLIEALNDQLNVKVRVHSIELNGLRNFPQLSLRLNNLRVEESLPHYNEHLIQARHLVVAFNPLKLLSGKNEVDKIILEGGTMRLYVNGERNNFQLFKPQESEEDQSVSLDLQNVILSNFRCIYYDQAENRSFNYKAYLMNLKGKFDAQEFELDAKGTGLFDHLMLDGKDYIKGKVCAADLTVDINQETSTYAIKNAVVQLDDLSTEVAGIISMRDNAPLFDLTFSGEKIDVQSVLSVFPNQYRYALKDLTSAGNISLKGYLKGQFNPKTWPDILIDFKFDNTSFNWPSNSLTVKQLNLEGRLENSSINEENLDLSLKLHECILPKSTIQGKLTLHNIEQPSTDFALKGVVDLDDLKGFLHLEGAQASGKSLFNLTGNLPSGTNGFDLAKTKINGDVECKRMSVSASKATYMSNVFLKTHINQNELTTLDIDGTVLNSDLHFRGRAKNWLGYLFKDQRLALNGSVKSAFLDLNFGQPVEPKPSSASTAPVNLDFGIDLKLSVQADSLLWYKLKAGDATGAYQWNKAGMVFSSVHFNAWQGVNDFDGNLDFLKHGFRLHTTSQSEGINLSMLMEEFDNFDQAEFTQDNLHGKVNATADMVVHFDKSFNVIEDQVKGLVDFTIENGQLKDYEPMNELSAFVELEDLQDIKFEKISNTIEIGDRMIDLPSMHIQSNAMNLDIGGTHTFDNYMNYRMKIRVTELLAKSSGWVQRKKDQQLEENKDGGLSAYIIMTGPPEDLKIRYDRKAVNEHIKQEIKKEKKKFIEDLKKEIKGKRDTSDTKKVDWDE